jgi:hypothetical protein
VNFNIKLAQSICEIYNMTIDHPSRDEQHYLQQTGSDIQSKTNQRDDFFDQAGMAAS